MSKLPLKQINLFLGLAMLVLALVAGWDLLTAGRPRLEPPPAKDKPAAGAKATGAVQDSGKDDKAAPAIPPSRLEGLFAAPSAPKDDASAQEDLKSIHLLGVARGKNYAYAMVNEGKRKGKLILLYPGSPVGRYAVEEITSEGIKFKTPDGKVVFKDFYQ